MNLKRAFITAAFCSLAVLTAWEFYSRSNGYVPGLEDNKELWAVQRAKVEDAGKEGVVLLGSSRVLFDIQLDQWEQETGIRPIQLASTGASPLPSFHDIVENTNFAGTVIVGVAPPVFFSTTFPGASPMQRIQDRVDHFENRTYADRLNHLLDIPLQRSFAFLANDDEDWADDLDLKTLVNNITIGNRTGGPVMPPFYRFQDIEIDRNLKMMEKTVTDTAFANTVIRVWGFFGSTAPPPDKESTTAFFLKDLEKFRARGGNAILLRCPSSGGLRAAENQFLPRDSFWDELVGKADIPAYHFEDYSQLNQFHCPEWSHLSGSDAATFTTELTRIMKKDQVLPTHKTN